MKTTDDGSVWLLGTQHLIRFRFGDVLRSYPLVGVPDIYQYTDFIPTHDGVWLLTYQAGLAKLDLNTGQISAYPASIQQTGYFNRMSQDAEGNIWIARRTKQYNLIGKMADGSWQRPEDPDSLLAEPANWPDWPPFYVYFSDAATDEHGNSVFLKDDIPFMYRIKQGRLQQMATSFELGGNNIRNDRMGRLWLFKSFEVWNGYWEIFPYLMRIENYNLAEKADLTEALPGNIWPYDLAFDRSGNAWVATNKGVVVYNKEGVRF